MTFGPAANHTCSLTCCTCCGVTVWNVVPAFTSMSWRVEPAIDKAWRWFDVFRTQQDDPMPRHMLAQASALMRRLMHTSAKERRRWKRRQWLHAMYAL